MVWFLHANAAPITPLVSGVQDGSDPNHPTEIYYGSSAYESANEMLDGLGVVVYPEDKFAVFPDPALKMGSKLEIQRALPISVSDAGKVSVYRTWAGQLSDFFTEQNILLGNQDIVSPDQTTVLKPDLQINITRVAETELKEQEAIAYKTITHDDPNMDKGKTRVEQAGKNGTKVKTYLIRRENGVEVSRKLINEEVTLKPQDKIIYVGTRVVVLGRGNATWYNLISGMTAAHNTLPRYSYVKVTAVNSGKSVIVKIVDRGIQSNAIIDLSADAFSQLAPLGAGVIPVVLTVP